MCVHPLNKDVSQAIIDTLLSVTANVSFYFIAILALRVKGHSLQILIISRVFRLGKLLGFGQNSSEIIP